MKYSGFLLMRRIFDSLKYRCNPEGKKNKILVTILTRVTASIDRLLWSESKIHQHTRFIIIFFFFLITIVQ